MKLWYVFDFDYFKLSLNPDIHHNSNLIHNLLRLYDTKDKSKLISNKGQPKLDCVLN